MKEHWHCPYDCDRPQKFKLDDDIWLCGKCWFMDNERVEMLLCTPDTCPGERQD